MHRSICSLGSSGPATSAFSFNKMLNVGFCMIEPSYKIKNARAPHAARGHSYLRQLQLIPSGPQWYWRRFCIEQTWQLSTLYHTLCVCGCCVHVCLCELILSRDLSHRRILILLSNKPASNSVAPERAYERIRAETLPANQHSIFFVVCLF
jgi:hypothetical protein